MTTIDNITATWNSPQRFERFEQHVSLTDAPDLMVDGRRFSPYAVTFELERRNGGNWTTTTALYAHRRWDDVEKSLVGIRLDPHQLGEVPAWLNDLTEQVEHAAGAR
jgi:hypothetical protein